ncbi:MAG: carbohydrate ABC transporter permease, partial [Halanaerobiales bacterium]
MHSKTNIMHKNKDRKKNQFKKIFREQIFPYIILTLVGLLFLAPFAWLVITSLKTEKEIFHIPLILWPGDFQWGNYLNAINYIPFLKYTLNTLIIAVLAIIGQVISSPLVAYSFARLKYKGRDILFYIMLS